MEEKLKRIMKYLILVATAGVCVGFLFYIVSMFFKMNGNDGKSETGFNISSVRFCSDKNCPDGNIDSQYLYDNLYFELEEVYYMVIDFSFTPLKDNDGSGKFYANTEVSSDYLIKADLEEANSATYNESYLGDVKKISVTYSIQDKAEVTREMRVVVRLVPRRRGVAVVKINLFGKELGSTGKYGVTKYLPIAATQGLAYEMAQDNSGYFVSGIGDVSDSEIIIPSSHLNSPVIGIKEAAFLDCKNITHIYVPQSVTKIGLGAFENCTNLKEIEIPFLGAEIINESDASSGSTPKHFGYIFGANNYGDNSKYVPETLKQVAITSGQNVGYRAFYQCANIKSIVLSDSIKSIGGNAFEGCNGIAEIFIPNNVKEIMSQAFYCCKGLQRVTISYGVVSLYGDIFDGCSNLKSVVFENADNWYVSNSFNLLLGNYTDFISVDCSNSYQNVKYFRDVYNDYYWMANTD